MALGAAASLPRALPVLLPVCRKPAKKAPDQGQVGLARGEGPGAAVGRGPWTVRMALLTAHGVPHSLGAPKEEDLIEEDDIPVRSFFPENWL